MVEAFHDFARSVLIQMKHSKITFLDYDFSCGNEFKFIFPANAAINYLHALNLKSIVSSPWHNYLQDLV